ncbi:MAG TPA: DUF2017 family protein [Mycobacteriales bacterium]|nr:DUF2017 family protein [Mycobacteriales bacterium]
MLPEGKAVRLRLGPQEREFLGELLAGLAALLEEDAADDPALRRLRPDGYADAEAAAEFRQLTEDDLRRSQLDALDQVRSSLRGSGADAELVLDAVTVEAWLMTLTQMRLVLAVRLGLTEDSGPRDDPEFAGYDWLTALQDLLVRLAMDG